jgi:hypothetical protein
MAYVAKPLLERVWLRVKKGDLDDCWPFMGDRDTAGYGRLKIGKERDGGRRQTRASRVAWESEYGPIPAGLCVCHRCDNPPCCNPRHLFLGTKGDNNRDRQQKKGSNLPSTPGERNPRASLTDAQAVGVMARLLTGREQQKSVALSLGISVFTVNRIWLGKNWTHLFQENTPYGC